MVDSNDPPEMDPSVTQDPNEAEPMHDAEPTPDKPKMCKFIRRADWGAKPPKWIKALETPVNKVVLTWTETDTCTTEAECIARVREIQVAHMQEEGVPDIKHNFLVGGDGALYEGRGYTRVGPDYPPSPRNSEELTGKSIEIAFIQRHADGLSRSMADPVPTCVGEGRKLGFITNTFEFLYYFDGKILSRQHARTKETRIKAK